ncbi:hypothetical protein DPMN_175071 [Dreissena polymorpha]|uniref:Uncharacterized protein n=1 Tax=Dreissena polymorpha TaxID=45954 RepID=A0A9D4IJ77_DREPO|nr:hypothetical protein DPMN_175071 [Dreissena polymorpha]
MANVGVWQAISVGCSGSDNVVRLLCPYEVLHQLYPILPAQSVLVAPILMNV